jgi:short-subunit dehydrogenase
MTTALITGASLGIGRELARVFAEHGHSLVLVARSEDKLREVAAELEARFEVSVAVVPADLRAPDAAAQLLTAVKERGLTVDYLVNNAGFGSTGPFLDADLEREIDMIHVNVTALVELTHLFAKGMVERRTGGILNIASTAGFQPGPGMATYYATKAYVVSFTEALAHELRGTAVKVTVFCPGPVDTEFARTAGNADSMLFRVGAVASPESVAKEAYRAVIGGQILAIYGFANQMGVQMLRISPRALIRRVVAWANSKAA